MDRYAVVGNPIAHSKSPPIHQAFARATGQDMSYERLLAPIDGFPGTVAGFAAEGGRGLNVTVPFKLEAFAVAGKASARAEAAGACNTLKRDGEGWYADNTDGAGLVRDLTANLGVSLRGRDVLVLGAGGAARGILLPLLRERPRSVTIANRTAAKADALAARFSAQGPIASTPPAALPGRSFDVVINATSAGLGGDVELPWPRGTFRAAGFAYDMIYADTPTTFLRWALAQGVAAIRGWARHADRAGGGKLSPVARGAPRHGAGVRIAASAEALRWPAAASRGRARSRGCSACSPRRLLAVHLWFAAHILWWRDHPVGETSFMAYRMDELHARNPKAALQYRWVPYDRISTNLKRAMVAAEDAKFVDHEGFDWDGIQQALEKNQRRGRVVAGGSTITQQLAKNLFLTPSRSYLRKAEEAVITVMLEALLTKRRILEIYLNVIEWGSGVFGAEAASRHYFGAPAAALSAEQAARLAAMAPNPALLRAQPGRAGIEPQDRDHPRAHARGRTALVGSETTFRTCGTKWRYRRK